MKQQSASTDLRQESAMLVLTFKIRTGWFNWRVSCGLLTVGRKGGIKVGTDWSVKFIPNRNLNPLLKLSEAGVSEPAVGQQKPNQTKPA
jgi:hypothetical protein